MRIFADTSVWIDHFRTGNDQLTSFLRWDFIVTHRHVIGELALGSIKDRKTVLASLDKLTHIEVAKHPEVRTLIEERQLFSKGIGYIDAHLLAATAIDGRTKLWTLDRRLKNLAQDLDLSFEQTA